MTAELQKLKSSRAAYRRQITMTTDKLQATLLTDDYTVVSLEFQLTQLRRKEMALLDLNEKVQEKLPPEDIEADIMDQEAYLDKIVEWVMKAEDAIRVLNEDVPNNANNANNSNTSSVSSSSPIIASGNRGLMTANSLPRLEIPKFSGEPYKWTSFWSQFEASIHNQSYSAVSKFCYLKAYLEDTAARAVEGYEINEENYHAAIDLLKKRFGRKDVLISAHIKRLINLTPFTRAFDVPVFRRFFDQCEVEVKSLQTLGIAAAENYGTILCPVLLEKLPDEIRLEFSRKCMNPDSELDLEELMAFLRREVQTRELALSYRRNPEPEDQRTSRYSGNYSQRSSTQGSWGRQRQNDQQNRPRIPSNAVLTTGNSQTQTCMFCENSHKSEVCGTVTSIPDRKSILKKKGYCFNCVTSRHMARNCKVQIKCDNCGKRHHRAVCEEQGKGEKSETTVADKKTGYSSIMSIGQKAEPTVAVLLQTAKARAESDTGGEIIRLLVDSGSQGSFIHEKLSKKLGLPLVEMVDMKLHTFAGSHTEVKKFRKVKLRLRSLFNKNSVVEIEVLETPTINTATFYVPGERIRENLGKKGLKLADDPLQESPFGNELMVLVGSDFYWKVVRNKSERINDSLAAVESIFGWLVQGPSEVSSLNIGTSVLTISINMVQSEEENISKELRAFWDLESLGIIDNACGTKSVSDQLAIKHLRDTITYDAGRYVVKLLWRDNRDELSNNYYVAQKRLQSLVNRLVRDNPLFLEYQRTFEEYLKTGIIEVVEDRDLRKNNSFVYYLPHQPVVKRDRTTTKTRIVFDASSKENGKASLNECLEAGPNLNPDIFTTLVKFRSHKVALVADVEKAFLQIQLHEDDRDAVRFLWIEGPLTPGEPLKIKVMRFASVLFGVTSSPFLLAGTIRHHIKKFEEIYPETTKIIDQDMYVDDLLSGSVNDEEAYNRSVEAKSIMSQAGMTLRKWQSNSEELRQRWIKEGFQEDDTVEKTTFQVDSSLKVLGLSWRPREDHFTFEVDGLLNSSTLIVNTKRCILKTSAKIFDPIGFIAPFTVRIKILYQEIWQTGYNWDQELPQAIANQWKEWCKELIQIRTIKIPRYYQSECKEEDITNYQLHCFTDASQRAYGAVVYLRYVTASGFIGTTLISSKTRVAPTKKVTLPRLELLGTVVGARLTSRLKKYFKVAETDIRLWSDSTITLYWIKSSAHKLKPFVSNRVSEIQELTEPTAWRHCSGRENPADYLSRGLKVEELAASQEWWTGPLWLRCPESQWPKDKLEVAKPEIDEEIRSCFKTTAQNICVVKEGQEPIFKMEDYSRLEHLLRVTAWVLRLFKSKEVKPKELTLSVQEIKAAEIYWIKQIQKMEFDKELDTLENEEELAEDSKIEHLNPFLDTEGVMRVGGRLQMSHFSFSEKHPVILPTWNHFSTLQVMSAHERVMHAGLTSTLTQLRETFWIPKARPFVKKVLKKCRVCKKWLAKPFTTKTAPLPLDRVSQTPPFQTTGIDFAGPVFVKGENNESLKAYIALYTCAVTRAIHLELVSSLTTECFILSLRRFISRRGLVKIIYSDNAKTFKKADRELLVVWRQLDKRKIEEFSTHRGITWKYSIDRAPWYGGFWERMVKSVKNALRRSLGTASFNFEEFTTVLTEVEAVVNSRPITYLNEDHNEPSPLTPAHFLTGGRLISLPRPSLTEDPNNVTGNTLRKRWRYQQDVVSRLWQRWKKEYLLNLRSAHEVSKAKMGEPLIKEGDIVIVSDDNQPRQQWKLARVDNLHIGRDGLIRSCTLKTTNGSLIKRPLKLLYPMEVDG